MKDIGLSPAVRIGTRGSALALWQARTVQQLLEKTGSGQQFQLEIIKPEGDVDKHSSLTAIGGRGVFTSALQRQLLDGRVDLAVHSTKDLPSLAPNGVTIAAFPQREDARDALISRHGVPLEDLSRNPVIGTSSRRRAVQIKAIRPDAEIRDLRGNIDTRLKKGMSDAYDAMILAAAGLHRMGWDREITALLPIEHFVPAPGQGALAVETRVAPDPAWDVASLLDDPDVRLEVVAERAFLRGVGGGCTTPIGAYASVVGTGDTLTVRFWGMLASDDGSRIERVYEEFPSDEAQARPFAIAQQVLRRVAPKWTGVELQNPLDGIHVLVTGSDTQTALLLRELASRGAKPIRMPTIAIAAVLDSEPLRNVVDSAVSGGLDWLVATSVHAAGPIAEALRGRTFQSRIAVVGARTAEAFERLGMLVDLTADGPGAEQLIVEMKQVGIENAKVACLLSDRARPVLAEGLKAAGANVDVVTACRNVPVADIDDDVLDAVRQGKIEAVTFASPSSVESFQRLLGADLPALSSAAFFAIGPTTAGALEATGLPVHGEAPTQDAAGFISALTAYFGRDFDSNPSGASK